MNNLLQECLNPYKHTENESIILQQLQNEIKIHEFKVLLLENNNLAYIFLKTSAKKLITSPFTKSLLQDLDFIQNVIKTTQKINYNMFCSFFEVLSLNYVCDQKFYINMKNMIAKDEDGNKMCCERVLYLLSVCFKKYEIQTRSNDLYTEINSNVYLFGELIINNMQNMFWLPETLQIYYYFIFQDIPTYFEERSDLINILLNKIYTTSYKSDYKSSNEAIKIFILYITKYSECCNHEMLLNNIIDVFLVKDNITQEEMFVLLQFIRRRNVVKIKEIFNILYKLCHIQTTTDALEYTRNVDKIEDDPDRKEISDAIIILNGIQQFDTQYINFGTREGDIFFFCVLKYSNKIIELLNQYKNKIINLDEFAIFTIYRYLKEQNINFDLIFSINLALKFDFAYYKLIDYINSQIEDQNYNVICCVYTDQVIENIIKYKSITLDDEYTSKFLFESCKIAKKKRNDLFDYSYTIVTKPENMSNFDSYFYLLNLTSFFIDNALHLGKIFKIAQNIFVKEATDLYSLSIQLFAVLAAQNFFDNLFLTVFSNEQLWKFVELQIPLSFLSIELYKKKRVEKSVIENLVFFLIPHNIFCVFLILENMVKIGECTDDYSFSLLMSVSTKCLSEQNMSSSKSKNMSNTCHVYEGILCVLASLNIENEKLNIAVLKCVEELSTKVVNKRSINKVRNALNKLKPKVNENIKQKIEYLMQRNSSRVCENRFILHTIKQNYEL